MSSDGRDFFDELKRNGHSFSIEFDPTDLEWEDMSEPVKALWHALAGVDREADETNSGTFSLGRPN